MLRDPCAPGGIVLANSSNQGFDQLDVEPRLRLHGVALLPVAGLLSSGPRHGLTDDIVTTQVHEEKGSKRIGQNLEIAADR